MNRRGLRVDSEKTQGLFRKTHSADRYLSRLAPALIIEGRPIVILRPGIAERGAGRRNPPETKLRGGGFAGVAVRALQRGHSGRYLVQKNKCDACCPLGHIARVGIELSRESSGNGSSAATVLTGVAELALPGVLLACALD